MEFNSTIEKVLAAYNYGMTNVDRHLKKYGTLNISELPSETQGYIKKIRRLVEDKNMSLTDAQIQVESANRPNVISNKGAVGLMQILPTTAEDPGFTNPDDVNYSAELAELSKQFKGRSKKEITELLKNSEINKQFGVAYRNALIKKYTEKLPEPERLAQVDTALKNETSNVLLDTSIPIEEVEFETRPPFDAATSDHILRPPNVLTYSPDNKFLSTAQIREALPYDLNPENPSFRPLDVYPVDVVRLPAYKRILAKDPDDPYNKELFEGVISEIEGAKKPYEEVGAGYAAFLEQQKLDKSNVLLTTPIPTETLDLEAAQSNVLLDTPIIDKDEEGSDFAHISTSRRVEFGGARERMVLGILWDMGKGRIRSLADKNKTYAEAMDEINVEELENIYKKFPEFRGVSFYDEDAAMLTGRLGVAFVDPVTYLLPWTKAARSGYLATMGLGGSYAAAYTAGLGHVERDETFTSPEALGLSGAAGAVLSGFGLKASRIYSSIKANRIGTEVEKLNTEKIVDKSRNETQQTLETIKQTEGNPSVKIVNENAEAPQITILKNNQINRDAWNAMPFDASTSELANASRQSFSGRSVPEISRSDLNYINETTEKIINASGSKFVPDAKVATELTNDLQIIIRQNEQLKKVKKKLKNFRGGSKKRAELKKLKLQLEESLAAVRLRDLKNTVNRMLDGQDLAELTFDTAVKEGKLTHGIMQALIREGTRPVFGALGGFTASQFFADTEDGYGETLAWTAGGAALMQWQKKIQAAKISEFDKETGEMIIHDQWRKWMSTANFKFLTASTTSNKLDSLGGVAKVIGNLLFDRPGGATKSVESMAGEAMTAWSANLHRTLGTSRNDEQVLSVVGEALNKFIKGASPTDTTEEVLSKITPNYKGLNARQIEEVKRIVPLLEKQRDDLAVSIEEIGVPFERLDDYGMAQIYNLDKLRENPERFKQILMANLPELQKGELASRKLRTENKFNSLFPKNSRPDDMTRHYKETSFVDSNYNFRPLMNHFEKERYIKDFETRRLLAEEGFINLNVKDVMQIYAKKTIEVREFAKTFGPNSERLAEAFREIDRSFKKAGFAKDDARYLKYKDYVSDSINAYFGKYGTFSMPYANIINPISQSLVALSNMRFLTKVALPSMNDFLQPFKATSIKAGAKAFGSRLFGGESAPSRRMGLKYNDDFEDELRAILVRSNDPLSSYTARINNLQRGFFKLVQLKRVTEQAGRYAFDAGAFRAFDVAKIIAKKKSLGKPLQREIKEMGLQNEELVYLAKFKNANEAFEDPRGKQILTRAGTKVMDRDRLIPKVGNRLLFTQHRDATIRQVGQFASWAQGKTGQTNAMIKRIEDGDIRLFMRILGATAIAGGAINFLDTITKANFDEDDLDPLKFAQSTLEMTGDFNNWFVSRALTTTKYNILQGSSMTEAVSPSYAWLGSFVDAIGNAYTNLVEEQDVPGAIQDIGSTLPIVGEYLKQAERFDLPRFIDRRKDAKDKPLFISYAKGGEVFEVPNVPSEPDERIDKMTGLPYDQQAGTAFVDEEDPLRRLGFGLGSIVARAATKIPLEELATRGTIMPTRPIKDIIPDKARAERAVDAGLTQEGYHGTLSPDIEGFQIKNSELGIHIGTPEQAHIRAGHVAGETRPPPKRVLKDRADADAMEDIMKNYPEMFEDYDEIAKTEAKEAIAKLRATDYDIEEVMDNANILPVLAKANNPLRLDDVNVWSNVENVATALLDSAIVKRQVRGKEVTDYGVVKDIEDFRKRAMAFENKFKKKMRDDEGEFFMVDVDAMEKSPAYMALRDELKEFIKSFGYDSIVYLNKGEVHYGFGGHKSIKPTDSLIIFEPKDIRLRTAEFKNLESDRLLDYDGGKVLGGLRKRKAVGGVLARALRKLAVKPLDIGVDESLITGAKIKSIDAEDVEKLTALIPTATTKVKAHKKKIMAPVEEGTKTGIRLNLQSSLGDETMYPELFEKIGERGFKLQTVHPANQKGTIKYGQALSYVPFATVENAKFSVNQKARVAIASKALKLEVPEAKSKFPSISVDGNYTTKRNVLDELDDEVVEIGMSPVNQHLFIDMRTGQAVESADIATIIGDRVYAKGVKYFKKTEAPEPLFTSEGDKIESSVRYRHNQGGFFSALSNAVAKTVANTFSDSANKLTDYLAERVYGITGEQQTQNQKDAFDISNEAINLGFAPMSERSTVTEILPDRSGLDKKNPELGQEFTLPTMPRQQILMAAGYDPSKTRADFPIKQVEKHSALHNAINHALLGARHANKFGIQTALTAKEYKQLAFTHSKDYDIDIPNNNLGIAIGKRFPDDEPNRDFKIRQELLKKVQETQATKDRGDPLIKGVNLLF
jgi:hypothetical protein